MWMPDVLKAKRYCSVEPVGFIVFPCCCIELNKTTKSARAKGSSYMERCTEQSHKKQSRKAIARARRCQPIWQTECLPLPAHQKPDHVTLRSTQCNLTSGLKNNRFVESVSRVNPSNTPYFIESFITVKRKIQVQEAAEFSGLSRCFVRLLSQTSASLVTSLKILCTNTYISPQHITSRDIKSNGKWLLIYAKYRPPILIEKSYIRLPSLFYGIQKHLFRRILTQIIVKEELAYYTLLNIW